MFNLVYTRLNLSILVLKWSKLVQLCFNTSKLVYSCLNTSEFVFFSFHFYFEVDRSSYKTIFGSFQTTKEIIIAQNWQENALVLNIFPFVEKLVFIYNQFLFHHNARCLKITEKVSFNIASEASYVYILSGQKLIKNAKNCPFWRVFENLKLAVKQCYQTGHF